MRHRYTSDWVEISGNWRFVELPSAPSTPPMTQASPERKRGSTSQPKSLSSKRRKERHVNPIGDFALANDTDGVGGGTAGTGSAAATATTAAPAEIEIPVVQFEPVPATAKDIGSKVWAKYTADGIYYVGHLKGMTTRTHKVAFSDAPDVVVKSKKAYRMIDVGTIPPGARLLIPEDEADGSEAAADFIWAEARGPACDTGCCLLASVALEDAEEQGAAVTILGREHGCVGAVEGRSVAVNRLGISADTFESPTRRPALPAVVPPALVEPPPPPRMVKMSPRIGKLATPPSSSSPRKSGVGSLVKPFRKPKIPTAALVPEPSLLFQGLYFLVTKLEGPHRKLITAQIKALSGKVLDESLVGRYRRGTSDAFHGNCILLTDRDLITASSFTEK
jgi:hypothetical protein